MDELELLKKQWQSREQELPTLSYDDIYKMLLNKSSSIVKWIFYISIGEILLWTLLAFFVPESSKLVNDEMGLHTLFLILNIINYCVFAVFIYLFYKNYQKIEVTDTVKKLMRNILKTRKTVKYFVVYNVGFAILLVVGINLYYYTQQDQLYSVLTENYSGYSQIPQETFTNFFFVSQIVVGAILIGLLMLFYRIIYGILLKRLQRNYTELSKIEL